MSGIAGFVDNARDLSNERDLITKMTNTLEPRGVDCDCVWLSTKAALGGRPMFGRHEERQYVMVFDGRIYDSRGIEGDNDAEVALNAYIQHGQDCVAKLNGAFAFAIWDDDRHELFLARDRFGVRPLFYAQRGSELIFGSELKAILSHPKVEAEVDKNGLAEVFGLGPVRTPGVGVFKDVNELRAAHCLVYHEGRVKEFRYWEFESRPHTDSPLTTAEKVRQLLKDAIKRQTNGESLCTLLSGGLDSSAISAVVASSYEREGKVLSTYSFDYIDNDKHFKSSSFQPASDAKYAKIMAEELGSQHEYLVADTDSLLNELDNVVSARDLPGMGDIDSSLLYFFKQVANQHNIAISGEGADEIFGGYPWLRNEKAHKTAAFPWSNQAGQKMRESILSPEMREHTDIKNYVLLKYQEAIWSVPRFVGDRPKEARIRELLYLNINWFMAGLLDRSDRLGAAAGLEVRVPFCDYDLVDYVWNIPWEIKDYGGFPKGILRLALKGILPDEVLERKKSPYPKTHNPHYERVVGDRLKEVLHDSGQPINDLVDKEAILRMIGESTDAGAPFFGQLMAKPQMYAYLLQVNFWLNKYGVMLT